MFKYKYVVCCCRMNDDAIYANCQAGVVAPNVDFVWFA